MALDGISASVSALGVSEQRLNQTANNLANVSTTGYVPQRVEQASLPNGGVQVVGTTALSSGPIVPSDRPLDLAINGGGFFVLNNGQGGNLYTRAGNFSLNGQGQLVDAQGHSVVPGITVPAQTAQLYVSPQGQVQALDSNGNQLTQGQLQTAAFGNPGGLQSVGGNAYQATEASGPPVTAAPGTPGHGEIVSGALQASGTDIAMEMVNLIIDQRTFEANIKALETQDKTLGSILDVIG